MWDSICGGSSNIRPICCNYSTFLSKIRNGNRNQHASIISHLTQTIISLQLKIDPPLTHIPTCQTEKTGLHISGYHQSAHFRFCGKDIMLSGKLRDLRGRGTGWFNSLSAAHLLPFERLRQLATPWFRSETRVNYSAVHGLTSNSCEYIRNFSIYVHSF